MNETKSVASAFAALDESLSLLRGGGGSKYTAYEHRKGVIKVENKDGVVCDCINDMQTAELIATALNTHEKASAKLSERKTVHEWLNAAHVPREESGQPLCLLRRLRIAIDRLQENDRREYIRSHPIT